MKIEYKITEYFEKNHLFEEKKSSGIKIKIDKQTLILEGTSRDLVELADILINVAKIKDSHIHMDDLTLLRKDSDISEIIIENNQ